MKKLLLVIALASCMPTRHLPKSLPPLTIPLMPYEGSLRVVDVGINSVMFRFVLDTGAALSVVSPEVARHGNCSLNEGAQKLRVMGEVVDAPLCNHLVMGLAAWGATLDKAGVYDVNAKLPAGWGKIDGVLALDSLAPHALTVDYVKNRIVLETNASLTARVTDEGSELHIERPLSGLGVEVQLPAKAKNGLTWFTLDTALNGGARVSKSAAEQLGLPLTGTSKVWATLSLGAGVVAAETSLSNDAEARLGGVALEKHAVTIDFKNARVWVQ